MMPYVKFLLAFSLCLFGIFTASAQQGGSGASSGALAAPPAPRFEIRRFVLEGNTLLPQAEVDRLLAPHIGPGKDFGNVQQALESLQDAYNERGYTAVRVLIPEQEMRSGEVKLQVTEARIGDIVIEGNRFFDAPNIKASLPSLAPGNVPNTRELGLQVQLANENPAKQATVALEAADAPGKVNALVRVTEENPSRVSLSLDNSGNSQTGYMRAGVGYQHANVFNADHVFSAQYLTSPTNLSDVTILGLGYRIPVYAWGGMFDAVAGYSSVNSGTVLNLFSVSGSGSVYGLKYTQLLPRVENYEQRVSLGIDYRDTRNNVKLLGPGTPLLPDITVKPLGLTYSGRYNQPGQDLSFSVSYFMNLPGGGSGGQDAFTAQRPGAPARFNYYRYAGAYTLAFGDDLLLRAGLSGQYTRDLLIGGEQFGMGGADSVRGFFDREVSNDNGHRISLEGYTPDFGARIGGDWRARGLLFFDAARGNDIAPVRGPDNGLSSVGFGFRVNRGKALSIRLDWAVVMSAAGSRPSGKDKAHLGIVYSY